jgi:hypothetical protein
MNRERAINLLAQIAEDTSQPGYARVNALRALLDALPADDQDRDARSVAEARKLIRRLNGDRTAA